jgi:hypothetical protein
VLGWSQVTRSRAGAREPYPRENTRSAEPVEELERSPEEQDGSGGFVFGKARVGEEMSRTRVDEESGPVDLVSQAPDDIDVTPRVVGHDMKLQGHAGGHGESNVEVGTPP